jgi:hypothetical protein
VARSAGFEPTTHGLEGRCSIQLSYERLSGQTSTSFGTKRVVLCPPVSEWQSDLEVAQLVEGLTLLVFHFLSLSGLGVGNHSFARPS